MCPTRDPGVLPGLSLRSVQAEEERVETGIEEGRQG